MLLTVGDVGCHMHLNVSHKKCVGVVEMRCNLSITEVSLLAIRISNMISMFNDAVLGCIVFCFKYIISI